MRPDMTSYNSYKLNVKKLRLLLRAAREQYYGRRLDSLNNDVKQNWKVSNSLMSRNKKSLHKECIVDVVSTNGTTKICDALGNYFIEHPSNIQGSITISTSRHSDHIKIKKRSLYFWNATETDIKYFIMRPNKEGGINHISREFLHGHVQKWNTFPIT